MQSRAQIRKCGSGSRSATRFGTAAPRAPPSNRFSPAHWKLPSTSAPRLCGRRHSGGCGPHCRCRADYPAALEMARRFADVAESTGDVGAVHLADRILGLTYHFLGHQPTAREFTQRALRHAHLLDSSLGLGYQVETPVAMAAQLGRILWVLGFADQAMD